MLFQFSLFLIKQDLDEVRQMDLIIIKALLNGPDLTTYSPYKSGHTNQWYDKVYTEAPTEAPYYYNPTPIQEPYSLNTIWFNINTIIVKCNLSYLLISYIQTASKNGLNFVVYKKSNRHCLNFCVLIWLLWEPLEIHSIIKERRIRQNLLFTEKEKAEHEWKWGGWW